MILLNESAKNQFRSAVNIDTKGKLTSKDFIREAYTTIKVEEVKTDVFEERCKWFAGKLIPGVSDININDIAEECSLIRIEGNRIFFDNKEILGDSRIFLLTYLSVFTSVKDAFRNVSDDIKSNVLDSFTKYINKELMRVIMLNRQIYDFDSALFRFIDNITNKGINFFPILLSSLVMLLLLDSNFCYSDAVLLLILARATKSVIFAARKYIYVFLLGCDNLFSINCEFIAKDILLQLKAVTLQNL